MKAELYSIGKWVRIRRCGDEYDDQIAQIVTVGKLSSPKQTICASMDCFELQLPDGTVGAFCCHEFTPLDTADRSIYECCNRTCRQEDKKFLQEDYL